MCTDRMLELPSFSILTQRSSADALPAEAHATIAIVAAAIMSFFISSSSLSIRIGTAPLRCRSRCPI
jgi:hypothetical protein